MQVSDGVSDGRVADAKQLSWSDDCGASSERVRQLDSCEGSKVTLKSSEIKTLLHLPRSTN